MPLTRDFKATVQARIARDPKYRKKLLREGVECLLAGDLNTGKALLRDYINATIGFEELSDLTHTPIVSFSGTGLSSGRVIPRGAGLDRGEDTCFRQLPPVSIWPSVVRRVVRRRETMRVMREQENRMRAQSVAAAKK